MLGLNATEWSLGAVALAVHATTNGLLPSRFQVPIGLLASATTSLLATRAGADRRDQGLTLQTFSGGALYGVATSTAIAAGLMIGARSKHSRPMYAEETIMALSTQRAAYEVFVRIPLGTALPEEVIFRGALLGLFLRHHSPAGAAVLDSLLFGLWHIAPTLSRLPTHGLTRERTLLFRSAWLALTVGSTFVSGLALAWLRLRSGSLLAPWMVHCTANCVGFALTRFQRR